MRIRSFAKPNRCHIKNWRNETAAEAVSAINAFRSGKLESASADKIVFCLQKVPR
jgi:hypothetical protein